MRHDQFDSPLSTDSDAARDAYVEGLDKFLAAEPGIEEAYRAAISADDGFALPHLALARYLQIRGRGAEIGPALARARELAPSASHREQAQIEILGLLLEGRPAEAYPRIRSHLAEHPRDALIAQTCMGVFGLIGFSGQRGREAEQLAFTTTLVPHWGGDWWFDSMHAFSLLEVGRTAAAEPLIEKSLATRPRSANGAHIRAHLYYENGEAEAGRAYIADWRKSYPKEGMLHCHVAWHEAIWALEAGDVDRMWEVVDADVTPDGAVAPPLNILTDSAAIFYRAELAGHEVPAERWRSLSAYASQYFPNPGLAFADAHAALTYAMAGEAEPLERLISDAKGPAAEVVSKTAEGFAALAKQDWSEAARHLSAAIPDHERLGGSRAQRDLVEFALASALMRQGKAEEARRLLAMHRPVSTRPGVVAGV